MDLNQLAKMNDTDLAAWVRDNTRQYTLISDSELETIIEERDNIEEKATELAMEVGVLLKIEVGEHSNANCPVRNAINACWKATHIKDSGTNDQGTKNQ